ncbi:F-box protein At5g49610-like [Phragmites australis]|uniref:F-box protein At5g49610-like n=1 Tax=Phragmites australis TaxID=29695 RepID=UPI002D784F6E|nr:F-box protein At5g49610-like [Phragmites australis]
MESTAGARKRQPVASASASATAYIPEELIRDILVRLPSRSVLRLRTVCKAWLRLASDPEFALEHHRRQPSLPLVSFLRDAGSKEVDAVDCCVEALDLRADDFRSVVRFTDSNEWCGRFLIHGSCDGLLLLSFDDRLYVCNPATHQWTRLPTPLYSSLFAGFYRHDPTGEYRALFYRGSWPGTDYYILVADSRKGRGIGLPSEKDVYKFKEQPGGPPALLRGSLHWPPQKQDGHLILVFNTVTEVFGVMFPPPVIREHMSLLEMENKLTMLSCGDDVTMVELWLLQDYENNKWVCKHQIELPAMKVSTFHFDEPWRVFFMSEEGVVLVTPQQKLLHYDMNGDLWESFRCDGRHLKITLYTLKESLIRHRFFEMQENADDGEDEPPPFFWGL